jgi:adenylate cyclase
METLAVAGGICISGNVHEHVVGAFADDFEDLGPQQVKNLNRPVPAFKLNLSNASGLAAQDSPAPTPPISPTAPPLVASHLALPEKPSIAVLPFQNMSGDAEQEYFADGMSEDIITSLSRYRSLFVIARNSTFTYKGQSPDLRDLSRDLGVRYVLEGSVRKGGSRIRVTAQLIEGVSGNHIWAECYDRELDDIFELQDEITKTIVSAIGPEIDQTERDRARRLPPENLDVWESYQRGLWHMCRFNLEDNAEAQRLFRQAAEASETFAPAHAGLTHALYYAFMHGHGADREAILKQAYRSGQTAVVADERDADAHFALGRVLYLRHELSASLKAFEAAIARNENFAHAHLGHGTALVFDGQWEACISACDVAARLSPHDPVMWTLQSVKALALIGLERYQEAVDLQNEATQHPTAAWTA